MAVPPVRSGAPASGRPSFHELMLWVAAQTDGDAHAPRPTITLGADGGSRHSGRATSMTDPEIDRSLQTLVAFERVAGRREARGSLVEWHALRSLPQGMVEVGAWPPEDARHLLPTGCALWDGRDAPLLAHIAVRGPFEHVPCVPSDSYPGAAQDIFPNVPVSRVDGYWSLMALRDGALIAGIEDGHRGWRAVAATRIGASLVSRMR
jgi:hypothetical protein